MAANQPGGRELYQDCQAQTALPVQTKEQVSWLRRGHSPQGSRANRIPHKVARLRLLLGHHAHLSFPALGGPGLWTEREGQGPTSWLASHTATFTTSRKRSQADARSQGRGPGIASADAGQSMRMGTFPEGSPHGLGGEGRNVCWVGSQKSCMVSGVAWSKKNRVKYVGKISGRCIFKETVMFSAAPKSCPTTTQILRPLIFQSWEKQYFKRSEGRGH